GGRRSQPDRQVQQRGLARPVRADQGSDVAGGDLQGALAQRPRAAVPLAKAARLEDVHQAPWPRVNGTFTLAKIHSVYTSRKYPECIPSENLGPRRARAGQLMTTRARGGPGGVSVPR